MHITENSRESTLTTPRFAKLIDRLFHESRESDGKVRELLGALPPEERARRANTDYRQFYGRASDLYLAVSPETAKLLYMLARANGARGIVEFGTSFGISTLYLAAALHDNGGGRLVGSELEPSKAARARANLTEAGLADLVEVREGDALETLARDLPQAVDIVLFDGHKPLYERVLDLVAPQLRSGAFLVADNADASPGYLARVRGASGEYLSVPFADDVEVSMKL
jgi:predicted O-methyltransferase YrrM